MTGIKSIDIKIEAFGNDVVNWNGSTTLKGIDGKWLKNHTLPKLEGFTNFSGEINEKGTKLLVGVNEINFKENPLYISPNCIRHFLFKDENYDLHFINEKNNKITDLIPSLTGLVRGYVVANSGYKKASPLHVDNFVEQLGNGTFETFVNSSDFDEKTGKKGSTSLFSKTTFGETKYIGYASLNIEDLQFLSLDGKFDRKMANITNEEAEILASKIETFLKEIDPSKNPSVIFNENYVRRNSIFKTGEAGILLDDVAIDILVKRIIEKFENLHIRQSQGWMCVENVVVDYNSGKAMRIKRDISSINENKNEEYAIYFEGDI